MLNTDASNIQGKQQFTVLRLYVILNAINFMPIHRFPCCQVGRSSCDHESLKILINFLVASNKCVIHMLRVQTENFKFFIGQNKIGIDSNFQFKRRIKTRKR